MSQNDALTFPSDAAASTVAADRLPAGGNLHRVRRCRRGVMMYNPHDAYIGRSLDLYGEYSEGEVEVFARILRPGDTAVDAGAQVGAHTIAMARLAGSQGRVVAFEPQRVLFQLLCGNAAINSLLNVDARAVAAGDAPGSLRLPALDYSQPGNFGGVSLSSDAGGEVVDIVTLDSLRLPECRLIKVDVEGMESAVLRGAVATIARCRPFLYVEDDRPEQSAELHELLASLRYTAWRHHPPYFNPVNFAGQRDNVFPRVVSCNLLCVPQETPFAVAGLPRVV